MQIREVIRSDAAQYGQLRAVVLAESDYMLREPDEYSPALAEIEAEIDRVKDSGTDLILVAEAETELIGFVTIRGATLRRTRHSAGVFLAVRKSHWRKGVARRMLKAATAWAKSSPLSRLEMSVAVENVAAVKLYQEQGFAIEGTRRCAVRIGTVSYDDHIMSLLC